MGAAHRIDQKITAWEVASGAGAVPAVPPAPEPPPAHAVRAIRRPEVLQGETYKIRDPLSDHAYYITINDIPLPDGRRWPREIFINSKCMENFAWIVALTRVISAVFRATEDVAFLAEELRSVFDPRGGYFKPGGKYMPSLVADIGACLEQHLVSIGVLQKEALPPEVTAKAATIVASQDTEKKGKLCSKCNQFAVVRLDGCETCVECGWSKCG
ncbi:MAG: TSCPD domain-containing protein [Magnetococcales bacterium]|nr:TSCPD domain-containing protein [Magnetococcales bacterium]